LTEKKIRIALTISLPLELFSASPAGCRLHSLSAHVGKIAELCKKLADTAAMKTPSIYEDFYKDILSSKL
jgi:hypothetical protein